jgi:hypothetical protein
MPCAGPVFLTRIYEEHPRLFDDVIVYPSTVFYPVGDDDRKYRVLNTSRPKYRNTYAVHRWHHLWLRKENDRSGGAGGTIAIHGQGLGKGNDQPHNGDGQYRAIAQRREQNDLSVVGNSTHSAYLYSILSGNVSRAVDGRSTEARSGRFSQNGVREPGRYFSQLQLRGANSVSGRPASLVSAVQRAVFGSTFVGTRAQQLLFNVAAAFRKSDDLADVDRPPLEDLTLAVATFPRDGDHDWFHAGSHKIGTSTEGRTEVHVAYPHSQAAASHSVMREVLVFLQVRAQANGDENWLDTFVASVRSVNRSGEFELNVARLDNLDRHGWAQDLRLYYLVVSDVDECQGLEGRTHSTPRRCGVVIVGPSDDREPHCAQISGLFNTPFPPAAEGRVQVLLQARCESGTAHHYDDVHSTVVTRIDLSGFDATVARVDRVGGSWGQRLEVQYVAWVADNPEA